LYGNNSSNPTTLQEIHNMMGATYTCGYSSSLFLGDIDDQKMMTKTVIVIKFCQYFSGKCRASKYLNNFPPGVISAAESSSVEGAHVYWQ
jgi:hypothetical protein